MIDNDLIYLHGESEKTGILIIRSEYEDVLSVEALNRIRDEHLDDEQFRKRPITILGFGVDHGLGAHAGNGPDWRTTVVAHVRYDYLKAAPRGYIRLEGNQAVELLSQLAEAVAIKYGRVG